MNLKDRIIASTNSVLNGKELVRLAINDNGGNVPESPTFKQLADVASSTGGNDSWINDGDKLEVTYSKVRTSILETKTVSLNGKKDTNMYNDSCTASNIGVSEDYSKILIANNNDKYPTISYDLNTNTSTKLSLLKDYLNWNNTGYTIDKYIRYITQIGDKILVLMGAKENTNHPDSMVIVLDTTTNTITTSNIGLELSALDTFDVFHYIIDPNIIYISYDRLYKKYENNDWNYKHYRSYYKFNFITKILTTIHDEVLAAKSDDYITPTPKGAFLFSDKLKTTYQDYNYDVTNNHLNCLIDDIGFHLPIANNKIITRNASTWTLTTKVLTTDNAKLFLDTDVGVNDGTNYTEESFWALVKHFVNLYLNNGKYILTSNPGSSNTQSILIELNEDGTCKHWKYVPRIIENPKKSYRLISWRDTGDSIFVARIINSSYSTENSVVVYKIDKSKLK